MIIGVDIDNVIADTERELRRLLNEKKGLELTREHITSYSFDNVAGIERADLADIFDMFNDGDIFLHLDPIDGARETLEMLQRKHRIVLVTARPPRVEGKTRTWLARHEIPFDDIVFAEHTKVNGTPYDLFFEDQPEYARELAEDGTFVLLFDAPWNRDLVHENIDRVYSWSDVQAFCFPPCALGK